MITRNDMITRFGEREIANLTDHGSGRVVDEDVLQRAIDDAIAEAGSYLAAAGYRDLAEPVPRVLALKVCDIARYYLHQDGDIEIVDKRYKAAIDWLKSLVKEPRLLGLDAAAPADNAADTQYAVISNEPEGWHATHH